MSTIPARVSAATRPSRAVFVRCALASIVCVALEYALLHSLVAFFHVHYLLAALVAGVVYVFASFLVNRRWAFRARGIPAARQLLRHGIVTGGGIAMGTPLLWFFVRVLGLTLHLGWLTSGLLSFVAWTYPMHKRFTFALGAGDGLRF